MPVERLRDGETILGTMISMVRHPAIAAIAKNAGMDFIMLDMEHGPASYETLSEMSAAARAEGVGCFVRVPELSRGYVSRALDCGATGVMAPMIETVEQARQLVSWTKYPPAGKRGLGSVGGHTGHKDITDAAGFMEFANRNTLSIAQIETRAGIEAIDSIAALEGVDALLIGPLDLSVSLGAPGDFTRPEMTEAIGRVADAARAHSKIFGMHAGGALLEPWIPRGLRLLMNSLDIHMLSTGMSDIRRWYERVK